MDICKHNIFSVITGKFLKCLLHCKHVHLNRKHCFSQSPVTASANIPGGGKPFFSLRDPLGFFFFFFPLWNGGIGRGGGCYFKKNDP